MHDLDRVLQELESDQTFDAGTYEFDLETEREGSFDGENGFGVSYEDEAVLDEMEQMEQAAALLEVQDEAELDQFIGGLINKAKKKLGSVIPGGVQQALKGTLKRVAKVALPKVGSVLGNMAVPGLGGIVGGGLMSNASKLFGLELEGMSYEDQEFEVAKRVVGLGAEATKVVAQTGPGVAPEQAAKTAVVQAARTHAPGLVGAAAAGATAAGPSGTGGGRRSGRWFRRGRGIVVLGA